MTAIAKDAVTYVVTVDEHCEIEVPAKDEAEACLKVRKILNDDYWEEEERRDRRAFFLGMDRDARR